MLNISKLIRIINISKLIRILSDFFVGILSITIFFTGIITLTSDNNYVVKFQEKRFSYKDPKNNKTIGFDHVKLKIFQNFDLYKKKYDYFLSSYGINYLIKRFIQTNVIGPEIAGLRAIIIGDNNSIDEKELGRFVSATNEIYINIDSLFKGKYQFPNVIYKEEDKAELILDILIHEYGHYFFTYYANSPVSSKNAHKLERLDISQNEDENKKNYNEIYNPPSWNKNFYEDFKKIFYNENIISFSQNEQKLINYIKRNNENLFFIYDKYKNPKFFFQKANKYVDDYYNNEKMKKYYGGSIFFPFSERLEYPLLFQSKQIMNYELSEIIYYYSIEELVTRKFLSSTYKRLNKYKLKNIFEKSLMAGVINDAIRSSIIIFYPKTSKYKLIPFYNDGVYQYSKNIARENLNPKKYLELIEKMMTGTEKNNEKPEISFITSKSPWKVLDSKKIIIDNWFLPKYKIFLEAWNQIKLGGYLPNNDFEYTNIGYLNNDNKFISIDEIIIHDFKLGYKKYIFDTEWTNIVDGYKYWYTKNFVNFNNYEGKQLYFGKKTSKNSQEYKIKKIKTFRNNKYGKVSNYNIGMYYSKDPNSNDKTHDLLYGLETSKYKWWILPYQNNDGIILKKEYFGE